MNTSKAQESKIQPQIIIRLHDKNQSKFHSLIRIQPNATDFQCTYTRYTDISEDFPKEDIHHNIGHKSLIDLYPSIHNIKITCEISFDLQNSINLESGLCLYGTYDSLFEENQKYFKKILTTTIKDLFRDILALPQFKPHSASIKSHYTYPTSLDDHCNEITLHYNGINFDFNIEKRANNTIEIFFHLYKKSDLFIPPDDDIPSWMELLFAGYEEHSNQTKTQHETLKIYKTIKQLNLHDIQKIFHDYITVFNAINTNKRTFIKNHMT